MRACDVNISLTVGRFHKKYISLQNYRVLELKHIGRAKLEYSQTKEFLIIMDKSKSLLHGVTSSDFSQTTDT